NGECLPALQQVAGELGLGEHVRFLGEVRDVPALLARASVFVLPSLTEGISLTLLEAMARGLPVVATRVGGNPEAVAGRAPGLPAGTPGQPGRARRRGPPPTPRPGRGPRAGAGGAGPCGTVLRRPAYGRRLRGPLSGNAGAGAAPCRPGVAAGRVRVFDAGPWV